MAMFGRRRAMAMPKIGMPAPAQIEIPDAPMMQPMGAIPDFGDAVSNVRMPGQRTSRVFDTLGQIGDVLTGEPITAQMIDRRDAPQREAAARQQQQADEWNMWLRQREYERANPKSAQPTEFERLAAEAYGQSTPEYMKAVRGYVDSRANPMIPVQGFDEQGNSIIRMIPRSGGVTQPTIPQAPVGKLRPLGGPTQPASGNFLG